VQRNVRPRKYAGVERPFIFLHCEATGAFSSQRIKPSSFRRDPHKQRTEERTGICCSPAISRESETNYPANAFTALCPDTPRPERRDARDDMKMRLLNDAADLPRDMSFLLCIPLPPSQNCASNSRRHVPVRAALSTSHAQSACRFDREGVCSRASAVRCRVQRVRSKKKRRGMQKW